ncbi:MAG: FAD-dependent oxidoreductase [Firmicutes bacterium]|nr:FAD-dependent oxidoreductase [Bacillota bacterium]
MSRFPLIFSPGQISSLRIKNRVTMPSMATGLATVNGEVTPQMIDYYEKRAAGGVGLITVEVACVDPPVGQQGFNDLCIDQPKYIAGLNELVEAIHAHQTRAFIQLFHSGRQTSTTITQGETPVAPSAIPCRVLKSQPRELSVPEIWTLVQKYVKAAIHARVAGFDGIEIHAAHGYLLSEFLSPYTNHRTDDYGGSHQNRMRFLLEIIEKIREVLNDYPISVRFNASDFLPGGIDIEEGMAIARTLEQAGVDALNISSGMYESGLTSIEPVSYQQGWRLYLAQKIKSVVKIPVLAGGVIRDPQVAEAALEKGETDFVFIGRGLLADPDWPNKAQVGKVLDIRPCVSCNTCINRDFSGLHIRCAVNPETGRESRFRLENRYRPGRSVLVVGSGPAGLQAAIAFSRRGHRVELVEKNGHLGGLLNIAGLPPHKHRLIKLRDYLVYQVGQLPIEVKLNTTVDAGYILSRVPDLVVIATGALPIKPDIRGLHHTELYDVEDVLRGQEPAGKTVVVIGGGRSGCEVAEVLAQRGNRVTIVEIRPQLADDMERKNRRDLLDRLKEHPVTELTSHLVQSVDEAGIQVRHVQRPESLTLKADSVVVAAGYSPQSQLYDEIAPLVPRVVLIGDANQARGVEEAIFDGEMLAHNWK